MLIEYLLLGVGVSKGVEPNFPPGVTLGEGRRGRIHPIHLAPGQRPPASRFWLFKVTLAG